MRSPENVLESLKSKACNKSYKYERLYRNLYNPQFYLLAYQRIQAKPGNMTAGTDGKTIDGMGMARINALIEKMRDFSYQPNPARRTYIPKSNGKMRPLGIPSFDDKLIQEVVRLILESIYEPTFSDYSHGFRINRSCHTALKYVQKYFTGTKWFVEGDIKGCFDNVDHHVLIAILRKRIADEHFIGLLWKFLKAGYMEDWNYHNTYSGTPQGSIISPILANIYMNELDSYMAEYAEKFNCGNRRKINPAFKKKLDVCRGKEQRLKRNISKMSVEEKEGLIAEIRELRRSLKSIPYSDQMDDSYKRLCYIRYADDFLIGVIGSKEDAEQIKQDVGCFIRDAVLAHEVGHNKKRHTVQFMLASVIQTGVILWLFSLFVNQPALSMALGGDRACFQLGLIAFTILYSPLSMILGLVMNAWSRKNEYQADAFAARYYDGESLISGLKKISVKSLSNLTPHPLYEWVYYSHPSLLKRIRAIGQVEAVDAE